MALAHLGEHLFDQTLVIAVRKRPVAAQRCRFVDPFGIVRPVAIGGAARCHDELLDIRGQTAFDDVAGPPDVDAVLEVAVTVPARIDDTGQMHDAGDAMFAQQVSQRLVADIGFCINDAGNAVRLTRQANVDTDDVPDAIVRGQGRNNLATDKAAAACDKYPGRAHAGTAPRASSRTGLRDQTQARLSPATMCQTPHQAATIAIPPRPPKKVKINVRPRPEF